jgi:hypothetical protein
MYLIDQSPYLVSDVIRLVEGCYQLKHLAYGTVHENMFNFEKFL